MSRIDWTPRRISLALGALAGLAAVFTLADPGITVDEPLDVRPGRTYLSTLRAKGLGFFDRSTVDRVFLDNKEHPPLGRWLLGIASTLGEPFEAMLIGPDPTGIYVLSGRLAPAFIFAWLVAAIAAEAGRLYGRSAAFAAGFATIVMPRVFAHAHLGALDLFIAAFWCFSLIRAERAIESDRPRRGMAFAGIFWGMALLTKIHAWLLPPVVLVRAIGRFGLRRSLVPLAIWAAVGLIVFFVGWPWLWYDTIERFRGFLGTGVERTSISVQYFGHVYRDRDVPWDFPWLYFLATVPVGLHLFGLVGLVGAIRRRDAASLTYAGAIAFVLGVFSTNVPVYDGERLYLLVFPLWALVIGRAFASLIGSAVLTSSAAPPGEDVQTADPTKPRARRGRQMALAAFLLAQSAGLILHHPYGLSYYNLLVGGLPGANRLGLELAYWSESVDRRLLHQLARRMTPGQTAALAPTLAPYQGAIATGRSLSARKTFLEDEQAAGTADFLVVYRRSAYWSPSVRDIVARGETLAENKRLGVWLSRLIRRPARGSPSVQAGGNP
jgi:4-amino-4-deoxy-L-arabinose transferase-like glycosyltransferase